MTGIVVVDHSNLMRAYPVINGQTGDHDLSAEDKATIERLSRIILECGWYTWEPGGCYTYISGIGSPETVRLEETARRRMVEVRHGVGAPLVANGERLIGGLSRVNQATETKFF